VNELLHARLAAGCAAAGGGMNSAWRARGASAAPARCSSKGLGMASLFAIVSAPVRMHDGAFAIVIASAAGIEVKTFATVKAAMRHYRMLLAGLQMGAEPALDLVVVDGETDYAALRTRVDQEYERRI
jgi:hypothetical protein